MSIRSTSFNTSLISEVTERARKLRNQYKLQAQSLRARIEMRINRVPSSLRRTKIGDLDGAHKRQTKPVEQSDQMNIVEPQNNDTSKLLPPHQPLEVSGHAKKPSADLRSKKAMDKMDITGPPEISTTSIKPTPVERTVAASISTKSAEWIKPKDNVDQNNIYAWRESQSRKPVAKPAPAERSMAVSNNQNASEKAKPMVKVDNSDICGPTEITSGRGSTKSKSAERVTALSNNGKIAGKAKPMSNVNMIDISEPHKRNSVQLSTKPAPERLMAVSNIGTTTLARIRGIKRKR